MKNEVLSEQFASQARKIVSEVKSGKREKGIEFSDEVVLKEMIGTADGGQEFLEKVTYDLYQGRESVPVLYKDIYTTYVDASFPETMTANEMGPVQIVFLEKFEGGEVKFGTLAPGLQKVVSFHTYAAGIEYNEDMLEYNQTWKVTEVGLAFGEAYTKMLNHLHLNPIIAGSYVTTGGGLLAQKAKQENPTTGAAQLIAYNTSVRQTLMDAITVLPKGSFMLANSSDRFILEDAIWGSLYSDLKTPTAIQRQLSPENIHYYDGDYVTVGGKTYTYAGVAAGFLYLLVPKTNFKEYIKHDLRVDSNDGDLSRLIITQVVGRTRRALFAGLSTKYGVIKIALK